MMETNNQRIQNAIDSIKEIDLEYWNSTLTQRLEGGAGSQFINVSSIEELENNIRGARWTKYEHPEISHGCTGFIAVDLKGFEGIIDLSELDPEKAVTLDDRKDTGKVSCVVKDVLKHFVDFSIIILGIEDEREVVFTIHPGAPIKPSTVVTEKGMHGKVITVKEAIKMGLTHAKVV
jgi:hypothetical protein